MEASQRNPAGLVVTIALVAFLWLPLVVVVLFSFHASGALSFPFTGFSTRWYEDVLASPEFRDAFANSLLVAVVSSLFTFVLGTAAAYGLSRAPGRLRGPLAILFFVPLTLPGLFVGIVLVVFFARLEVELSLTTVAIAHMVFVFPYFLLIARAALDRLDPALEDVAADLGATPWVRFRRVTLPQVWPILVGASLLAFALSFDEFIITFFVIGADSTLPLYIWSGLRRTVDPTINVVATVLMLVTTALWVIAFLIAWITERRRRGGAEAVVRGVEP